MAIIAIITYHKINRIVALIPKPVNILFNIKYKIINIRIICDLGCGEGLLYNHFYKKNQIKFPHDKAEGNINKQAIIKKIYSYDLVIK